MNTAMPIRCCRALRLGLHLSRGLATVLLVYPFLCQSWRLRLKQRWSRQLLDILAVRIDARLDGVVPGSLFVANHVSWLDIFALNAVCPLAFVAKSEVRDWPVIGWLVAHTDTLFIRRGSRRDAVDACAELAGRLRAGCDVAIFPEGTTTDGTRVLAFRTALLQAAIDAQRPLQPIAIAYDDVIGRRTTIPAYAGETTMLESLAAILACRGLTVRLRATPALTAESLSRRQLAQTAHDAIAEALGVPATPSGDDADIVVDTVAEIPVLAAVSR